MKNILMKSIFNHSYLDLQIVVVKDETYLDDYKYTFSVNHYSSSEDERKLFIHDPTSRDQYLNGFTSLLRMRDMEYKPGMQFDRHMLFILDNPSLINNHPIMEFLEKEEERLGMSVFYEMKKLINLFCVIEITIQKINCDILKKYLF